MHSGLQSQLFRADSEAMLAGTIPGSPAARHKERSGSDPSRHKSRADTDHNTHVRSGAAGPSPLRKEGHAGSAGSVRSSKPRKRKPVVNCSTVSGIPNELKQMGAGAMPGTPPGTPPPNTVLHGPQHEAFMQQQQQQQQLAFMQLQAMLQMSQQLHPHPHSHPHPHPHHPHQVHGGTIGPAATRKQRKPKKVPNHSTVSGIPSKLQAGQPHGQPDLPHGHPGADGAHAGFAPMPWDWHQQQQLAFMHMQQQAFLQQQAGAPDSAANFPCPPDHPGQRHPMSFMHPNVAPPGFPGGFFSFPPQSPMPLGPVDGASPDGHQHDSDAEDGGDAAAEQQRQDMQRQEALKRHQAYLQQQQQEDGLEDIAYPQGHYVMQPAMDWPPPADANADPRGGYPPLQPAGLDLMHIMASPMPPIPSDAAPSEPHAASSDEGSQTGGSLEDSPDEFREGSQEDEVDAEIPDVSNILGDSELSSDLQSRLRALGVPEKSQMTAPVFVPVVLAHSTCGANTGSGAGDVATLDSGELTGASIRFVGWPKPLYSNVSSGSQALSREQLAGLMFIRKTFAFLKTGCNAIFETGSNQRMERTYRELGKMYDEMFSSLRKITKKRIVLVAGSIKMFETEMKHLDQTCAATEKQLLQELKARIKSIDRWHQKERSAVSKETATLKKNVDREERKALKIKASTDKKAQKAASALTVKHTTSKFKAVRLSLLSLRMVSAEMTAHVNFSKQSFTALMGVLVQAHRGFASLFKQLDSIENNSGIEELQVLSAFLASVIGMESTKRTLDTNSSRQEMEKRLQKEQTKNSARWKKEEKAAERKRKKGDSHGATADIDRITGEREEQSERHKSEVNAFNEATTKRDRLAKERVDELKKNVKAFLAEDMGELTAVLTRAKDLGEAKASNDMNAVMRRMKRHLGLRASAFNCRIRDLLLAMKRSYEQSVETAKEEWGALRGSFTYSDAFIDTDMRADILLEGTAQELLQEWNEAVDMQFLERGIASMCNHDMTRAEAASTALRDRVSQLQFDD